MASIVRDLRTAIGPLPLGAFRSAEKSAFDEKTGLAGNPSEVDRAARLREISRGISRRNSCGRPESRRDVQEITRRVGERTALAGRHTGIDQRLQQARLQANGRSNVSA
jgi:hypothetical protein